MRTLQLRFNGAAAREPRKRIWVITEADRSSLQWGRGVRAAEISVMPAPIVPRVSRFNGAAALEPRKSTHTVYMALPRMCFNGAAALEPRKSGRGGRHESVGHGFNGAAALEPRK